MRTKNPGKFFQINLQQIKEILPQRYPFLMIDRVIKADLKNAEVTCVKNVSGNEYYFEGHFPGNPIMPGALIMEAMAQSGIILYAVMKPKLAAKRPDYLLGKVETSYKQSVIPGDQLIIEVKNVKLLDTAGIISARAKVNSILVAEATISFGIRFRK